MSIPVLRSKEPVSNTLHSFTLFRLGPRPVLHMRFVETDWVYEPAALITAAEQLASGKWNHLVIPTWSTRTDYIGRSVVLADKHDVVIGKIASINTDTGVVHLTAGVDNDLTGVTVTVRTVNSLGQNALDQIQGGRDWTLALDSGNPAHFQRMQTIMVRPNVMFAIQVLDALGISRTPAEVQAAVEELARQGMTVEILLTQEFEQLEMDRRAGTIRPDVKGILP